MKRFYCTICKRIKRVRKLPATMDTPNADKVADRTGVCYIHSTKDTGMFAAPFARHMNRKVAK